MIYQLDNFTLLDKNYKHRIDKLKDILIYLEYNIEYKKEKYVK